MHGLAKFCYLINVFLLISSKLPQKSSSILDFLKPVLFHSSGCLLSTFSNNLEVLFRHGAWGARGRKCNQRPAPDVVSVNLELIIFLERMESQTIRTYKIQGETKHRELCKQEELWSQRALSSCPEPMWKASRNLVTLGYKHGQLQCPQF